MPTTLELPAVETRLCREIEVLLSLPTGKVTPATNLRELGMDSLRLVSLLIVIEKAFGVSLMKAGLKREHLQSVATLAGAVCAVKQP